MSAHAATTETPAPKKVPAPLNGINTPALFATIDVVKNQPQLGAFQFRADGEWLGGTHMRTTMSDFFGAGGEHSHRAAYTACADHPAVLCGEEPDAPLCTFPGLKGFLRQAYGPGWALVGDAGYFKDPLTAHGITDALRDAELLASAASAGTMAGYAAIRDRLSLPLFEVTDAIAALDWDLERVKALHQTLNQAMRAEVEHLLALHDTHRTKIEEEVA